MPEQKSFFVSLTHLVIASFRFCCSSCCLIEACTSFKGVCLAGLTAVKAWMMCQPYCVCTGLLNAPVFKLKATLSNGGTVCPFETVSFPPCAALPGSFEYFFAKTAKFASCAASNRAYRLSASGFDLTRICRTCRDSGCPYCALCAT